MKINKKITIITLVITALMFTVIGVYMNKQSSLQHNKETVQPVALTNGVILSTENVELMKYTGEKTTDSLAAVKVEISNEGGTNVPMGAIDFEAKLSNGKILSPDSNYSGFYFTSKSGEKDQRSLFFKIPKNEKIDKLIYHNDMKNKVELNVN